MKTLRPYLVKALAAFMLVVILATPVLICLVLGISPWWAMAVMLIAVALFLMVAWFDEPDGIEWKGRKL